ncbi:non-ribosomal peptide synthetase [Streptomyces lydicamycinicus]|uniref:non-ribosomal peptide synthetase n=1 Tax=Streptomyces lydicamycinicus TaxID=1546107 RepID=UPI0020363BE3|nr:non-ribosomal peptide synthetase [Streptomyces lydicamycinicus]URZ99819.1 non-ribosomal peptide synthetase [Streptomyces lydicamycinicus]
MTFDASTFEVWGALANGAAVVVCTDERPSFEDLARHVERHGVTVAFFTTALFHQLAGRRSRIFAPLRTVIVGGEAMSAHHARAVLRAFPWLELVNGYGPTEATTFTTTHRVTDADCDGQVPIGRPVAGAAVHLLDATGRPVRDGAQGELWIGGSRLAHGYTGQPELTAERFVQHPELGRLYRTGDLVSRRPDGLLDYHGRTDDQVKIRGFRIEPAEIEHALRERPEVADAAVTVHRPSPDDARLAAFVVAASGPVPRPEALRERLATVLPAHLVPDEVRLVDALPLTPSGKVDRRALTDLVTTDAPGAPAGPLGPLEEAVAEIWSRSLGREVARADADFLALGGHSLLALAVTDDLREEPRCRADPRRLLRRPHGGGTRRAGRAGPARRAQRSAPRRPGGHRCPLTPPPRRRSRRNCCAGRAPAPPAPLPPLRPSATGPRRSPTPSAGCG